MDWDPTHVGPATFSRGHPTFCTIRFQTGHQDLSARQVASSRTVCVAWAHSTMVDIGGSLSEKFEPSTGETGISTWSMDGKAPPFTEGPTALVVHFWAATPRKCRFPQQCQSLLVKATCRICTHKLSTPLRQIGIPLKGLPLYLCYDFQLCSCNLCLCRVSEFVPNPRSFQ